MKRITALFLALILVATLLTLSGCAKRTIQTEDGKVEVKSGIGGDKVTVTTDEGTGEFGAGTKLPANWPKDVPVYPGSTPYGNINISGEIGLETVTAVLLTNDSVSDVKGYYETELLANGWKIEGFFTADTDEGMVMTYSAVKGGRMCIFVLAEGAIEGDVKNSITITISKK